MIAGKISKYDGFNLALLLIFLFLFRQAFADDEAFTCRLHFSLSLMKFMAFRISNPSSSRSSFMLSSHVFSVDLYFSFLPPDHVRLLLQHNINPFQTRC